MSPQSDSPSVNVRIDQIRLRAGQTITVYVTGPDGQMVHVEIRSVGMPGANVGYPEIFIEDAEHLDISLFDEWTPMGRAWRKRCGIPRPPEPATKGDENG